MPELRRLDMIDERGNFVTQRVKPGAGPDKGFRHAGRVDLGNSHLRSFR